MLGRGIRSIVAVDAVGGTIRALSGLVSRGQEPDSFLIRRRVGLLSRRQDTTSDCLLNRPHGTHTRARADGVEGFRKQGVGNLVVLMLLLLAGGRRRRAVGGSVRLLVDLATVLTAVSVAGVLLIHRASLRPLNEK